MLVQVAIEARAVTCRSRAGEVTVRDVSLTVDAGELVAIIGGSSSGKETLLAALSGLRPSASGTVLRRPDRRIGYVPAGDSIDPVLPLARALGYTAALQGAGADAVHEALDLVGLSAEADALVRALDPGARKRAAIAAELLSAPDALFLDEPTALPDPAQASQVLRLLRTLCDTGKTVLLTTSSHLDAARCSKVAVLAAGGHLAFFGTPAGARGYFGADSLEEIYERLSGLGDPATAWSRRFFYVNGTGFNNTGFNGMGFNGMALGSVPVPALPRAPGPALLIPDQAGPHSAGRPSLGVGGMGLHDWSDDGVADFDEDLKTDLDTGFDHRPPSRRVAPLGPARQFPVLAARYVEVLARDRRRQLTLAAAPLAILLLCCVLFVSGALNGPAAVPLAWGILSGLTLGLTYGLPGRAREAAVLRRERSTGVSAPAFLTAKAAVLVPLLAVADLLILAVPAITNRLQTGFGLSYLEVFAASLVGLAVATSNVSTARYREERVPR
jgi:ABC-type multidrug transport system ATPase subunit